MGLQRVPKLLIGKVFQVTRSEMRKALPSIFGDDRCSWALGRCHGPRLKECTTMSHWENEEWLNSIKNWGTRLRFTKRRSIHFLNILRKQRLPHWNRLERRKRSQEEDMVIDIGNR